MVIDANVEGFAVFAQNRVPHVKRVEIHPSRSCALKPSKKRDTLFRIPPLFQPSASNHEIAHILTSHFRDWRCRGTVEPTYIYLLLTIGHAGMISNVKRALKLSHPHAPSPAIVCMKWGENQGEPLKLSAKNCTRFVRPVLESIQILSVFHVQKPSSWLLKYRSLPEQPLPLKRSLHHR